MNAYKLVKELRDWYSTDAPRKAADLIEKQADQIAELKLNLGLSEHLEKKSANRIAELEEKLSMYEIKDLDRGIIGKIGDSPIHDLVHRTTPQTSSEPVAWMSILGMNHINQKFTDVRVSLTKTETASIPLYTTPKTNPLSDEEIWAMASMVEPIDLAHGVRLSNEFNVLDFARAIEEMHGIK